MWCVGQTNACYWGRNNANKKVAHLVGSLSGTPQSGIQRASFLPPVFAPASPRVLQLCVLVGLIATGVCAPTVIKHSTNIGTDYHLKNIYYCHLAGSCGRWRSERASILVASLPLWLTQRMSGSGTCLRAWRLMWRSSCSHCECMPLL